MKYKNNTLRRKALADELNKLFSEMIKKIEPNKIIVVIERIRTFSNNLISTNYIKSMGALNAVIIDTAYNYGLKVYSVDTKAWKHAVIGTTKEKKNNKGVNPKKYPTIEYMIKNGYERYIIELAPERKIKGTFTKNGKRYIYNDDAADSACISLFPFIGNKMLLKLEK